MMKEQKRDTNQNKIRKFRDSYILHTPMDVPFFIAIVMLSMFGLIMIYSASYYFAVNTLHRSSNYFFMNQLRYVVIGIAAMLFLSFIRPKLWKRFWVFALILAFFFVFAVRLPGLGHASHGAYRWIKISSLNLQVAEPIKVFSIVAMGGYLCKYKLTDRKNLFILVGIFAVLSFLVYIITNNMSTAMILFTMVYLALIITQTKSIRKPLIIIMVIGVILVVTVITVIRFTPMRVGENFRITRIRAWLDPTNPLYSNNEAYQATQALYAIASGGFFGKGLGQSLIKFKLPEPHNDYILSIIFEELGVFGVLILTALFVYLFVKIFRIFTETEDRFEKYFVLGVFLQLALQTVLNYAVTLGVFPTMGVTLPFISAGGASLVFFFIELGIVMAIHRTNMERRLYRDTAREMEESDPYLRQLREEGRARRAAMKQENPRKRRRKE